MKPTPLTARTLIDMTVDPGTWRSWDVAPEHGVMDSSYEQALARAQVRTGTDEAVVTGQALVQGRRVALVVSEFGFLGGSIGRATSRRIIAAIERATRERLPLLAAPSSGGTRMQEGTPAFVTMIDITCAVVAHKNAGLPYIVYLRHPTTGGVFASWGSLGHVTVAEPGALVGFLGPSVFEALYDKQFPQGVQLAENLVDKGVIDAVVPPQELAALAARTLGLLAPEHTSPADPTLPGRVETADNDAWHSIQVTREDARPGVRELLRFGADDVISVSGTGAGERGRGLLCAFVSLRGTACVVIGQDRREQEQLGPLGPEGLRAARRMMAIAEQLSLPLVCVIDTPGAELSRAAEEGALASEIARCLSDFVQLSVPSVSVILGQGCGGGALALLPAQRVLVAEHAWLSPLPPEGASTILYGSPDRAAELARLQRVGSADLLADGVAHVVVSEPRPAHLEPAQFCHRVVDAVANQLQLLRQPAV